MNSKGSGKQNILEIIQWFGGSKTKRYTLQQALVTKEAKSDFYEDGRLEFAKKLKKDRRKTYEEKFY